MQPYPRIDLTRALEQQIIEYSQCKPIFSEGPFHNVTSNQYFIFPTNNNIMVKNKARFFLSKKMSKSLTNVLRSIDNLIIF